MLTSLKRHNNSCIGNKANKKMREFLSPRKTKICTRKEKMVIILYLVSSE